MPIIRAVSDAKYIIINVATSIELNDEVDEETKELLRSGNAKRILGFHK